MATRSGIARFSAVDRDFLLLGVEIPLGGGEDSPVSTSELSDPSPASGAPGRPAPEIGHPRPEEVVRRPQGGELGTLGIVRGERSASPSHRSVSGSCAKIASRWIGEPVSRNPSPMGLDLAERDHQFLGRPVARDVPAQQVGDVPLEPMHVPGRRRPQGQQEEADRHHGGDQPEQELPGDPRWIALPTRRPIPPDNSPSRARGAGRPGPSDASPQDKAESSGSQPA